MAKERHGLGPLYWLVFIALVFISTFVVTTQALQWSVTAHLVEGFLWIARIVVMLVAVFLGWVAGRGVYRKLLRQDASVASAASAGLGYAVCFLAAAVAVGLAGTFSWYWLAGAAGLLFIVAIVLMARALGWVLILVAIVVAAATAALCWFVLPVITPTAEDNSDWSTGTEEAEPAGSRFSRPDVADPGSGRTRQDAKGN